MPVRKIIAKSKYAGRVALRTFLCHYKNFFPGNGDIDLIEAHRDQKNNWDIISGTGAPEANQTVYDLKANLKLDFIEKHPGICLEIGSENGWFGKLLLEKFRGTRYIGLDFRVEELSGAEFEHHNLLNGDALKTPLKDSSVDSLMAFNIIEHIRDIKGFSREIHRILKENSRVVISTPLGYDDDPCHRWHFMTPGGWIKFIRKKLGLNYVDHIVDPQVPSEFIGSFSTG